jgi:MFS family permease
MYNKYLRSRISTSTLSCLLDITLSCAMSKPDQTAYPAESQGTKASSEEQPSDIANGTRQDVEQGSSSTASEKTVAAAPSGLSNENNPIQWPQWKKAMILSIICSCCLCVTCASSVISTDYTSIETELGASSEVAILSLSLFVLGLAMGPLLVGPFSERYGRRVSTIQKRLKYSTHTDLCLPNQPVYVISYSLYFLLGFPVAFANNLPVLFIFRFLTGFAGSGFLNIAGGSISDLWIPRQTFMPLAFFTVSAFLGPVIGPVYGSFVEQFSSQWRWTLWTITIWSFVNLVCLIAFTPETFAPAILRKQNGGKFDEDKASKPSLISSIASDAQRIPLLLYHEPMLSLLCVWSGILLGIIYLFFEFFREYTR